MHAAPNARIDAVLPDWPSEQRTHYMMYEDTSEGTPISPAFASPEELAKWLADTGASIFGGTTGDFQKWLSIIQGKDFAHVEIAPGVICM